MLKNETEENNALSFYLMNNKLHAYYWIVGFIFPMKAIIVITSAAPVLFTFIQFPN